MADNLQHSQYSQQEVSFKFLLNVTLAIGIAISIVTIGVIGFGSMTGYASIASQMKKIEICDSVDDDYEHDRCVMLVIRYYKLDELLLCEQMTTSWKQSCIHEIGTGEYLD